MDHALSEDLTLTCTADSEASGAPGRLRFGVIEVAFVGKSGSEEEAGPEFPAVAAVAGVFLLLVDFLRRRSQAWIAFAGAEAVTLSISANAEISDNPLTTLHRIFETDASQSDDFVFCNIREDDLDIMLVRPI